MLVLYATAFEMPFTSSVSVRILYLHLQCTLPLRLFCDIRWDLAVHMFYVELVRNEGAQKLSVVRCPATI